MLAMKNSLMELANLNNNGHEDSSSAKNCLIRMTNFFIHCYFFNQQFFIKQKDNYVI